VSQLKIPDIKLKVMLTAVSEPELRNPSTASVAIELFATALLYCMREPLMRSKGLAKSHRSALMRLPGSVVGTERSARVTGDAVGSLFCLRACSACRLTGSPAVAAAGAPLKPRKKNDS
jgi:hypothetical protein